MAYMEIEAMLHMQQEASVTAEIQDCRRYSSATLTSASRARRPDTWPTSPTCTTATTSTTADPRIWWTSERLPLTRPPHDAILKPAFIKAALAWYTKGYL